MTRAIILIQLGTLAGLTLGPGLYKWTSGVLVPADITFQGSYTDSTSILSSESYNAV